MIQPGTPSLDQLRVLIAVVETGSLAAAGRRLGRATSAVSYAIDNLEAQLGLAVFRRSGTKKPELTGPAQELLATLQPHFMCDYDETQNIGKRYRRQDELGTPLCITFDFESVDDHAVTVRQRDSMEQTRVPIEGIVDHVRAELGL